MNTRLISIVLGLILILALTSTVLLFQRPLEAINLQDIALADAECNDTVSIPVSHEFPYNENVENCRKYSEEDKLNAFKALKQKVNTAWMAWCAEGNSNCNPLTCKPRYSWDISNYSKKENQRDGDTNKKDCILRLDGYVKISCYCIKK